MLGPLELSAVKVVVYGTAFTCLGLAPFVAVTGAAVRSEKVWAGFAMVITWLLLIPYLGAVCLGCGLFLATRPSVERFNIGSQDYAVSIHRSWSPTDQFYLRLYRRDGFSYHETSARLPTSHAHSMGAGAIRVERHGGDAWLIVPDLTGADQQVRLR